MEQHTSTTGAEHTSANYSPAKDAKQLLSSVQDNIRKYKVRKAAIRSDKKKLDLIAATHRNTKYLFPEKFATVIKQIQVYRDLLNSIMNQVDIEAQIEYTQSKLLISRLGCDYRHYVFFAIASRANKQSQRFHGCDFLAFHGDAETNYINVYEYTEVSVCDTPEPRHLKRCAFKEYSKHLADDHIDKFDIEDLTYYIERYIDKTLQSIVAQSQQAT